MKDSDVTLYDEIWNILEDCMNCHCQQCSEFCAQFTDEQVKELARKYEPKEDK